MNNSLSLFYVNNRGKGDFIVRLMQSNISFSPTSTCCAPQTLPNLCCDTTLPPLLKFR